MSEQEQLDEIISNFILNVKVLDPDLDESGTYKLVINLIFTQEEGENVPFKLLEKKFKRVPKTFSSYEEYATELVGANNLAISKAVGRFAEAILKNKEVGKPPKFKTRITKPTIQGE